METVTIYGIRAKDQSEYFYVGSTGRPLGRRLSDIRWAAQAGATKNRLLDAKAVEIGVENLVIEALATADKSNRIEIERRTIINCIAQGMPLVNIQLRTEKSKPTSQRQAQDSQRFGRQNECWPESQRE